MESHLEECYQSEGSYYRTLNNKSVNLYTRGVRNYQLTIGYIYPLPAPLVNCLASLFNSRTFLVDNVSYCITEGSEVETEDNKLVLTITKQ